MPLTQVSFQTLLGWQLSKPNTGTVPTGQGDSVSFTVGNIVLGTFDELYYLQTVLAPAATTTLDLTSLTDLVGETFGFGHALTLLVLPEGSQCTVGPAASNPLTWFLGGTTQTVIITAGGMLAYSEPVAGPGHVVDSTHKGLTFTNSGGATLTLTVVILGSTA